MLHEIECPGTDYGLCTALHTQFATEVVDVAFDRVHAQYKATGDLAVGGAFDEQAQHLLLALGEGVQKRTRVSRGEWEILDVLLAEGFQQGRDVTGY